MRAWLRALASVLLVAALPAAAQYRWVDGDGRVNYGDQPPSDARDLSRIDLRGRTQDDGSNALPFELRRAMSQYPAALYTAVNCPACDTARVYLRGRGVPFQEIVVETEEEAAEMRRRVGVDSVPVMTLGRTPSIGFNESAWSRALDAATYPAQSQLPLTYRQEPPQPLLPRASGPAQRPAADAAPPTSPR
jgi:glutaredoxin